MGHLAGLPWKEALARGWGRPEPKPLWSVLAEKDFVRLDVLWPSELESPASSEAELAGHVAQATFRPAFCQRATLAYIAHLEPEATSTIHGALLPLARYTTTLGATTVYEAMRYAPPDLMLQMLAASASIVLRGASLVDLCALEVDEITFSVTTRPEYQLDQILTTTLTEQGSRVWRVASTEVTLPGLKEDATWAEVRMALDLPAMRREARAPAWTKTGESLGTLARHYAGAGMGAHGALLSTPIGNLDGLLAASALQIDPPTAAILRLYDAEK